MKTNNRIKRTAGSDPGKTIDKYTLRNIMGERDHESSFILLIVPVLLTFWFYYGKQTDFEQVFSGFQGFWNQDFYSTAYEYLTGFLLMFWVPFFIIKIMFKKPMKAFGIQIGDARYGFRFVAIVVPFIIWVAYHISSYPVIQAEYPLSKSVMHDQWMFLILELFYVLYYVGWEFLFRGFMLFGLEQRYGALTAILFQMIPSAIVHIGKPAGESFGAILAGIIFGYLAIRTRSILYPLLLHGIVGISIDIFVTLRLV